MEEEKQLEEDFLLDINDETEIYIIQAFENTKRPEDKQMKVHLKPFSGKDLANIASQIRKDIKQFQKDNPNDDRDFMELYNMFSEKWEFVHRITKLENFKYKKDGEEKEITSPMELYSFQHTKFAIIVSELRMKFMKIDVLNIKN